MAWLLLIPAFFVGFLLGMFFLGMGGGVVVGIIFGLEDPLKVVDAAMRPGGFIGAVLAVGLCAWLIWNSQP